MDPTPLRACRLAIAAACLLPALHAASAIRFSAANQRVPENAGGVLLSVWRLGDTDGTVTVEYATVAVTARAVEDYVAEAGSLTFEAGHTNQSIRILLLNDGVREGDETFSVTLSNPSANTVLGAPATATVVIEDNDPGLHLEHAQYWTREDAEVVVVAVARGEDETAATTVAYRTVPQTAAAGSDFAETSGTLSFAATERLQLLSIPILNDGLAEPDERFRVVLSDAAGNALGQNIACTVTIADNDAGVEFQVNQAWVHEDQGGIEIRVVRGNDLELDPFSIAYTVADLTTTPGADHGLTFGSLAFAAGEMSRTIWLPVVNDGLQEPDERLRIQLLTPTDGPALGRVTNLTCTATICDGTGLEPRLLQGTRRVGPETLRLEVVGNVPRRFQTLLSVLQLDRSADLREWQPVRLVGHVNTATNPPSFLEHLEPAANRFYRLAGPPMFTPCVAPTGPYLSGMLTRRVDDPSRRNRHGVSTNGSFLMTVWYPAQPRPGQLPAGFDDALLANDIPWQTVAWMDRAPRFSSYSFHEAPIQATSEGYPLVLYSHGGGSARLDNLALAADLASHGYVVAALDHADAGVTTLPDGTLHRRPGDVVFTVAGLQDRVRDLNVVTAELERLNQPDSVFRGHLDLSRLAALGWSWGGDTAGEFSRLDFRCRAVISLDQGGVTVSTAPALATLGVPVPSLTLNMAGNANEFLFRPAAADAYWLQISGTVHQDFSAYSIWSNASFAQGREAARTIHAYVRSFLNQRFLRQEDHLLDGPSTEYPRVMGFRRK